MYICINEWGENMSEKKYKPKKESTKRVNEPRPGYSNKKESNSITISTLKGQEESNYIYWLSLTPEERWAEHYKLLQRIYSLKKSKKSSADRIIFDA
jgi:hypothetical protein